MYCTPHLSEWQERVTRFFLEVKYDQKPEPLYAATANPES
jgi:hypothetical protein